MSTLAYLTSFASTPTMTLHNGTTIRNRTVLEGSGEVMTNYITLPNYVLYDPTDPTEIPPIVPGQIVAYIILKSEEVGSEDYFVQAEFERWSRTCIGQQATLTGVRMLEGTNTTCTARLRRVRNVTPTPGAPKFIERMEVEVIFDPLTNWA